MEVLKGDVEDTTSLLQNDIRPPLEAEAKTTREIGIQCSLGCVKKSCTKVAKTVDEKLVKAFLLEKGCSEVQIKQIFNGRSGKRYHDYTEEEICRGLVIRSLGEKTFCYLRNLQIFPLPSSTTLQL